MVDAAVVAAAVAADVADAADGGRSTDPPGRCRRNQATDTSPAVDKGKTKFNK